MSSLNYALISMAGGIILRITYGYEVQDGVDEFVELIERSNNNFNRSAVPGVFLVDVFPILKYFPEWLPGMGFLSLAREWKKDTIASAEVPYAFTKNQMVVLLFCPSNVVLTFLDRHRVLLNRLSFRLVLKTRQQTPRNISKT